MIKILTLLVSLIAIQSTIEVSTKNVKVTYYWIAFEEDFPVGTDAIIKKCGGGSFGKTSKAYLKSLTLECSGKLRNGKDINGGNSDCTCFNESLPIGSQGNKLVPYVSIAVNDIPFGTKVMVKQMKGTKLPNGKTHNGCTRVDDVSWSFSNNQIDWYVLRKANYEKLNAQSNVKSDDYVGIEYPSTCTLNDYGE